ncbi:restriction endonuclease subunit S [Yersinia intermedia]|uniref:restriction endonuclease subunit S n=1 Tax=Yersinia intermedia TaxID=631 RepID=UPI00092D1609|nr:restriction endonuclease subunit S [Yersinia intermedia]
MEQVEVGKYQPYPEYKDSGVEWLGDIPSNWSVYSLKRSVTGCTNGIWGDEPNGENDLIVLRVADFDRNKLRISDDKLTYRSISEKESRSRLLAKGDLLIEKSGGGDKTLVGCVVLFDKNFAAVTSNFVAKMSAHDGYHSGFLNYAFSHLYNGRINYPSIKQTTGIQNLDSESYLMERFCFPSYTEQRTIAAFLDYETARIDKLIAQQQRLIELHKEKRQAVISHAVTKGLNPDAPMKDSGVEWLGEVPEHWVVTLLRYFITTRKGVAFKAQDFCDDGVAVVKASDIKEFSFKGASTSLPAIFLSKYPKAILRSGNIVLSTVGSTPDVKNSAVGQLGMLPEELDGALLNQNTVVFEANSIMCDNDFLFLILQTQGYRDHLDLHAHGTANQASLNVTDMLKFSLPLPPLKEQRCIVDLVRGKLDKLNRLEQLGIEAQKKYQERRTALISAAVTGKIDLRGWTAPVQEGAA